MREQASESHGEPWIDAMAAGDFERAWQRSDDVLRARDPATRDDPTVAYHLRWVWDGRPVDGRSVLVRCYHGLGDTLQFCRYLPDLRRRARSVTVEAQAELLPLLSTLSGIDTLVPFDPANPHPPSECDLEIMELAHVLRRPPDPSPYLGLRADRHAKLRVGLCWRVGATWRPDRSLPDGLAADLLRLSGIEWVSLQRDRALPGLAADCPEDILATAHRIAGLHAVVSIDTMVAHLTGAVGVPLFLLLPSSPDWRWLAGGRGSVWYRQVRKYEPSQGGGWSSVLAALKPDLTAMARKGTLPSGVGF